MRDFKRLDFLQSLAGAAVLSALPHLSMASDAKEMKPNILFIWTDEQIFGMLSCEGNKDIQTPNLDRLAREGVLFNNSFCTYPGCSPSRATVITGAFQFNHRLYDNTHPEWGLEGLKPMDGYKITEQYLYDAGYAVGHRGKWHVGTKADWGKCFTADTGYSERYSPLWSSRYEEKIRQEYPWDQQTKTGKGGYVQDGNMVPTRLTPSWQKVFGLKGMPYWAIAGELLAPPEETMEYCMVDDTINFIESHKNEPWMATLSLSPPHNPWSVPEPYFSRIAKPLMEKMKIEGNRNATDQRSSLSWRVGQMVDDQAIKDYMAIYTALVVMMDDFIGRVLDTLDKNNLTDNTLVVFTSDHGDMYGLHGNVGKINHNLYNRLYHTPCIIRYPAKIKGGQVVDKPVMHTDFKPTLLDYAGIKLTDTIDGKSMRPLMEGTPVEWRDYHLLEKFMNTQRNPDHSIKNPADCYYAMGLEDGRYKYIHTRFNNQAKNKRYCGPRFIDLKNDPCEENNLFEDKAYREIIKQYHDKLRTVLAEHHFQFLAEYPSDPWAER